MAITPEGMTDVIFREAMIERQGNLGLDSKKSSFSKWGLAPFLCCGLKKLLVVDVNTQSR